MNPLLPSNTIEACFGWSAKAWARPFRQFLQQTPHLAAQTALEIGADAFSSLSVPMLALSQHVECSFYNPNAEAAIRQFNQKILANLPPQDAARISYHQRDVLQLNGSWDVIVMKSVLGGVFRQNNASPKDLHRLIAHLVQNNLNPGGMLVTMDNGSTALEPLFKHFGSRKNQWRFFLADDFPPAFARYAFGVLSAFSLSTRIGALGVLVEYSLYAIDVLLSPFAKKHAIYLHIYKNER